MLTHKPLAQGEAAHSSSSETIKTKVIYDKWIPIGKVPFYIFQGMCKRFKLAYHDIIH